MMELVSMATSKRCAKCALILLKTWRYISRLLTYLLKSSPEPRCYLRICIFGHYGAIQMLLLLLLLTDHTLTVLVLYFIACKLVGNRFGSDYFQQ